MTQLGSGSSASRQRRQCWRLPRGSIPTAAPSSASACWCGSRRRGLTGERCPPSALGAAVSRLWAEGILDGPVLLRSHGSEARRRFETGGAAAEAATGFPSIYKVGFAGPAKRCPQDARRRRRRRVEACFALIASLEDTNLLHRGGPAGLEFARRAARRFLDKGGVAAPDSARRVRERCTIVSWPRRLSPGGSADLLAMTLSSSPPANVGCRDDRRYPKGARTGLLPSNSRHNSTGLAVHGDETPSVTLAIRARPRTAKGQHVCPHSARPQKPPPSSIRPPRSWAGAIRARSSAATAARPAPQSRRTDLRHATGAGGHVGFASGDAATAGRRRLQRRRAGGVGCRGVMGNDRHAGSEPRAARWRRWMQPLLGRRATVPCGASRQSIERLCRHHDAAVAIVEPGWRLHPGCSRLSLEALAGGSEGLVRQQGRRNSSGSRLAYASVGCGFPVFRDRLRQVSLTLPPPAGTRLLSGIDGSSVVDGELGLDKLAAQDLADGAMGRLPPGLRRSRRDGVPGAGTGRGTEQHGGRHLPRRRGAEPGRLPGTLDGVRWAWLARILALAEVGRRAIVQFLGRARCERALAVVDLRPGETIKREKGGSDDATGSRRKTRMPLARRTPARNKGKVEHVALG